MIELLEKYYPKPGKAYPILVRHSRQVADKAVAIARRLADRRVPVDLQFVEEAALLHDIGILETRAHEIGCYGDRPYIAHGCCGRRILEREGLPRHALVCERHIGVGLSRDDIRNQNLPLPDRDMLPETLEEQIVTYADLFFSKSGAAATVERSLETVIRKMERHGRDKVDKLLRWHQLFSA